MERKWGKGMKIKTRAGTAEGMPLSDVQQYNKILNKLVVLGWLAFIYLVFMTGYVIYNNVLNNIVASWA